MRSFAAVSVAFLGLLLFACGDDGRPPGEAGNESTLVGGTCLDNDSCDLGLCQDGPEFPGNICTISCADSNQCPSNSTCVVLEMGWLCMVNCGRTEDCRTQWTCASIVEAESNGASAEVCVGPAAITTP